MFQWNRSKQFHDSLKTKDNDFMTEMIYDVVWSEVRKETQIFHLPSSTPADNEANNTEEWNRQHCTYRVSYCLLCASSSSPLYPFSVSVFPIPSFLHPWDADWSRAHCHGYRMWKISRDLVGRRKERQSNPQPLPPQMTLCIPSVHKAQLLSAPAKTQWMSKEDVDGCGNH